ncbi:hypothetical protein SV7mr_23370 [Stieleria bergensis]|uniref:Uncharacterized protein n=1 Tax=Stieleria bergensis TaxID=2528025 RepID=A0A517SUL5_9BACT|nr:hypothetical protein SV7mr_23370 [Planctomycetes bacterium SV_7m_r]
MRLLQIQEYLAMLDGGAETADADERLTEAALAAAESLWPTLHLAAWGDLPRTVESVARCVNSGIRLVHVTADWINCYLILVFPPESDETDCYILFDIGSEYSEITFECPAFGIRKAVSEELIEEYVPRLQQADSDPFAILDLGNGSYMQTLADPSGYFVEYQLVSLASHYTLPAPVDAQTVIALFKSYAFGKKEWSVNHQWNKLAF